ncbi:hypothetical protein F5Y10DRAFT_209127 [Nemania abortiva]|nr:hypothetical protein F5Y10DRAFT_209127 [Nemania abortiva]
MLAATLLLLSLSLVTGKATSKRDPNSGLDTADCQLRCPKSTSLNQIILPAITQKQHETGEWENVLECWSVDTTTTDMPGVDNAFRLDWEGGFDAAYSYIFYGSSFMKAHSTPEPSLAIMGTGIGDVRFPSGRCLRVEAGDIFFNAGMKGQMTAWWSEGAVISDLYFKDGRIPEHKVVPELSSITGHGYANGDEL